MEAMDFDHTGRMIFSPVAIPEDVVQGLRESFDARRLTGVELEVPEDYNVWHQGADEPSPVLCVSKADLKHYRAYNYPREVDLQRYDIAGRYWSLLTTQEQWRRFLQLYRDLDARMRTITGFEAPEGAFDEPCDENLAVAVNGRSH